MLQDAYREVSLREFGKSCKVKIMYRSNFVEFISRIPVVNVYTAEDMLIASLNELERDMYKVTVFSVSY
jgi:hypothetical protein